jgi:hypothetical protein
MKLALAVLVALASCASGCSGSARSAQRATTLANRATPSVDAGSADASARDAQRATRRRPLDERAICARIVASPARLLARATASVPRQTEPQCSEQAPMCDTVDRAPRGADACFVSNDHIARDERSIARESATGRALSTSPWNRSSSPQHLDLVDRHLHLSAADRSTLARNGFVAIERHSYDSYALAFHEIFRQQLPVFIGVDAILHAVFVAHSTALQSIEASRLRPGLRRMLTALRATLRSTRATMPAHVASDLDDYLAVADALLDERDRVRSILGDSARAQALFDAAKSGGGLQEVTLFGRARMVDFSQLTPRGHYTERVNENSSGESGTLESYFRAMMWLSRTEFNLVTRGCQSSAPELETSETPREALAALALAALVERSGQSATLAEFERVYSVFGGKREDVPLPELSRIGTERRINLRSPDAFAALRAGIGERFQRSTRIHFTPEGAGELPAIATMFGPRIVPDTAPLTGLVHDAVTSRERLSAADVGYLLGHDRAQAHLRRDLAAHPTLGAALTRGRAQLASAVADRDDLYSRWLSAARTLAAPRTGVWPSFASTDAFADYRLNASVVTYAQIRHNYVLLAGQGYDAYGCEIPDGYVEPAVETYDALLAFALAARAIDGARARFWSRMSQVLETLKTISIRERAGLALTETQKRWIGMVSEFIAQGGYGGGSGQPPKWTGWYFDLFADREIGAEKAADFIADYFTMTNAGEVLYLGARTPMLGVFVVDTNGPARVMVGPIARGYERTGSIDSRLDDERAREEVSDDRSTWRDSYTVRERSAEGAVEVVRCPSGQWRVALTEAGGQSVEVSLLDHHGEPISAPSRATIDADRTAIAAFELGDDDSVACEGVHVRVTDGRVTRDRVDPVAMRSRRMVDNPIAEF